MLYKNQSTHIFVEREQENFRMNPVIEETLAAIIVVSINVTIVSGIIYSLYLICETADILNMLQKMFTNQNQNIEILALVSSLLTTMTVMYVVLSMTASIDRSFEKMKTLIMEKEAEIKALKQKDEEKDK